MKKLIGKVLFMFGLVAFLFYLGLYMLFYSARFWWFWRTAKPRTFVYREGGWREQ